MTVNEVFMKLFVEQILQLLWEVRPQPRTGTFVHPFLAKIGEKSNPVLGSLFIVSDPRVRDK